MSEVVDETEEYKEAFHEFSGEDSEALEDANTGETTEEPEYEQEEPAATADEEVRIDANPWDNAPDELRDSYNDMQTRAESAEHKHRSDAGRVSAMQRRINELEAAQVLPQEIAAEEVHDPLNTDMDNDMPEIARDVRAIMREEFDSRFKLAEQQISAAVDDRLRPINAEYAEREQHNQLAALEAAHPDFVDIAKSQEYANWFAMQTPTVQQLASSDYANDAAAALSLFKSTSDWAKAEHAAMPASRQKRIRQLEASQSIRSRASNAAAPIADDDYNAAFAFYADKQDK